MPRPRCKQCLRPLSVCYCHQIRPQKNSWPVYILQDAQESDHAIGTARIAALSLSDCQMITVNPDSPQLQDLHRLQALQPVLIYPGDEAGDLGELASQPPMPLLFLDASWRRSRKMLYTQPWLADLPRFVLNPAGLSRYRIRQQPHNAALSTLEAIVHALQQLENEPERFNSLLTTMDWVIDQQIRCMGADTWQANYADQSGQIDHKQMYKKSDRSD